jgi:prepilin peptidase CpaA
MNLPDLIAPGLMLAAAGLVLYAAFSDIATMTIPNWVSIVIALAFPIAALFAGMPAAQIGLHIACGVAIFVVGFGLFHFGVLGGGDVKVFTAVAVWTGFASLAQFLSITFLAGGVLALFMLALRRFFSPGPKTPAFLNRLLDKARGVPYAVAIAAGSIASALSWPLSRMVLTHWS